MARNYFVIVQPTAPNLPLPAGSIMLTVNSANPTQALRSALKHLEAPSGDGEVVKVREYPTT